MASISSLEAEIRKLEKRKKTYEKRTEKLNDIKGKLNNGVAYCIVEANNKIETCAQDIEDAISVPDFQTTAPEDVRQNKEAGIGEDSYMSQIASYINNEIRRCNSEVKKINDRIKTIKAEVKRMKEEQRKAMLGGGEGGFR